MPAARLFLALAVPAAMRVAVAIPDGSAPAPVDVPAQDLATARRFAPVLKFDRASDGYPMSAQTFYEEGGGQPELVAQMTRKVQNTRKASLTSLANQPPTYFKTAQIDGQIRISYWWFYGFQEACVDVALLGRLRHRKGILGGAQDAFGADILADGVSSVKGGVRPLPRRELAFVEDIGDGFENLGGELEIVGADIGDAFEDGFEWVQGQAHIKEGHHNGDWENVVVALDAKGAKVASVTYSQHGGHYTKFAANGQGLLFEGGTHPVVFVGKIAHGSYHDGHVSPLNAVPGLQCRYFEDERSPASATDVMHAATHLVDLRGESEAWLVAAQSARWEWGHDGISTNPVQRELASTDLSCDDDGCARSECLPTQDRQSRLARGRRLAVQRRQYGGAASTPASTPRMRSARQFDGAIDSVGDAFLDLGSELENLGDTIENGADGVIGSVGDAFLDLGETVYSFGEDAVDATRDFFGVEDRDIVTDATCSSPATGDTTPIAFPLPTPGGFTRTHTIEMEVVVSKPLGEMSGSEVEALKSAIAADTVETTKLTRDDIDDVRLTSSTTVAITHSASTAAHVRGRRSEVAPADPTLVNGQVILTDTVSKNAAVAAMAAIFKAAERGDFELHIDVTGDVDLQVQLKLGTLRSAVTAQGPTYSDEIQEGAQAHEEKEEGGDPDNEGGADNAVTTAPTVTGAASVLTAVVLVMSSGF